MQVQIVSINFGTNKTVKRYNYAPKHFVEVTKIENSKYQLTKREEYINNIIQYSLVSLNRAGKWLKSKLSYFDEHGKIKKIIRSKAK